MRNTTLDAPSAALPPIRSMPEAMALAERLGGRATRLDTIKSDIAQSLACPELSVGEVAARHGVTARYLQLLFEREGTTFSEFVLGQRLVSAHRMLGDERYAHWSITATAFEAGPRIGKATFRSHRRSALPICTAKENSRS